MKTIRFDSGFRYDDVNSRWGDPSYQLEPGDPGYVPPPDSAPISTPKPKKQHKMPKHRYIKESETAFAAQLDTFKTNIPSYSTLLSVSAGQVTSQAADADYFGFALACQQLMQAGSQQWTAWRDLARDGGTPPPTGMPVAPVFPTTVTAVTPGIEVRFRALVQQIKAHASYNEAIGEALGIEGDVHAAPDMTTLQPDISAELTGDAVLIRWGWQNNSAFLDACEILVDRNDTKGYVMLAQDTTPSYTDTYPKPAAPAQWKYKAIYRLNDQRVGQWSNEVAITVAG